MISERRHLISLQHFEQDRASAFLHSRSSLEHCNVQKEPDYMLPVVTELFFSIPIIQINNW